MRPSPVFNNSDFELFKRLDNITNRARQHSEEWDPIYDDGLQYIFGDQLKNIEVKEGHSRIVDNQIFPAVTQEQALTAQNRVIIKALPFEESDTEASKTWEPILQWHYEAGLDIPSQITVGELDAKTHGHWFGRLRWNPRARWDRRENKWVGEVQFKHCRPELVVFDPDCEDTDKAEWVVEFDRMRLDEAKAEFPKYADELQESGGSEPPDSPADKAGGYENDYVGKPAPDSKPAIEGRLASLLEMEPDDLAGEHEKYIWVERIFFKDRTTKSKVIVDHEFSDQDLLDGGKVIEGPDPNDSERKILLDALTGEPITMNNRPRDERTEDVPLYPTYRHVCRAGRTKLVDEAWKLDDHPYAAGQNLPLPHTWHGLNGVEMVRGLQDVNNRIAMVMEAWIRFGGNPAIQVEEGAMQLCPDLKNVATHVAIKPCAIYKMAPRRTDGLRFLSPPPMPNTVPEVRELFLQSLRDATGVQEIGLGRSATGGQTATEAIRLETNTKLRTALQWKMVEKWILRVMRRVQAICQANFTPGEMRRITGPGTEAGIAKLTEDQFSARFDLRLEVATSLPFDRERRKVEAMELYNVLSVPFLSQLLDAYERPDKDEILKKVMGYQAILAAMQAEQAKQETAQQEIADGTGTAPGSGQAAIEPAAAAGPAAEPATGPVNAVQ